MASPGRPILFQQIDRLYRSGTAAAQDDAQLLARFVRDRDEGAFESLVHRHGPMVLGLCKRVLRDPRDIEDAFQATFLVLASRAGTIRNRDVLSSWLYGVAHRVAMRCRYQVLRRRSIETSLDLEELADGAVPRTADELAPVLDQELSRLPEKYRAPIVLCYLREQTHDQAAAELDWPVGTVRSRLARGRDLLRGRLTRRGWSPAEAMAIMGSGLTPRTFTTTVPQELLEAAVASAGRVLGKASAGAAPAATTLFSNLTGPVHNLAQGVITTMAVTKSTWIGSGLAALGLLAGGMGAGAWALAAREDGKPGAKPNSAVKAVQPPAVRNADAVPLKPPARFGTEPSPADFAARLADLERKLDLLLRLQGQPLQPGGRPGMTSSLAPVPIRDNLPTSPGTGAQIHLPAPTQSSDLPSPALAPVSPESVPSNVADSRPEVALPQPTADLAPAGALPPPEANASPAPSPRVSEPSPFAAPASRSEPDPFRPSPRTADSEVAAADDVAAQADPRLEQSRIARKSTRSRPAELDLAPEGDERPGRRPRPDAPKWLPDRDDLVPAASVSLREIQARILIARRKMERYRDLLRRAAISRNEADEPIDELMLLLARLRGMDEAASELSERTNVTRNRLAAELDRAKAQLDAALKVTVRNARLNNAKISMVSAAESASAEAEAEAAKANVKVKEADLQEAALTLKQLESRILRIRRLFEETLSNVPELKSMDK
jgi:RNA polymerase sigma factor (sigma-70 family)